MVYEGAYDQSEISGATCTHVFGSQAIAGIIIGVTMAIWRFGDYANSSNCHLLPWAYFPSVLGPWASNHSHTSTFIGPNRTMGPTIELDLFTWSTWTMWVKMAHGFGLCWLGYDSFEGKTYQPFQLSSRKTLQPLTFCLRKPLTFLVDRESTHSYNQPILTTRSRSDDWLANRELSDWLHKCVDSLTAENSNPQSLVYCGRKPMRSHTYTYIAL